MNLHHNLRSYLDEICGHGLLELVRCCSGDAEFRAWVLPSVKSMIEVSPEDLTPEGLAILLELEVRKKRNASNVYECVVYVLFHLETMGPWCSHF